MVGGIGMVVVVGRHGDMGHGHCGGAWEWSWGGVLTGGMGMVRAWGLGGTVAGGQVGWEAWGWGQGDR